jgi:putative membrane protein
MRTHALTAVAALFTVAACNRSEPTPADENQAAASDVFNNATGESVTENASVDSTFLTDAIKGDNGEVAIGKLAQAQGQSQAVKDFATLLVSDHGAHKQELAALAQSAGISVSEPGET